MPKSPLTFDDIIAEHPLPWIISQPLSRVFDANRQTLFAFDKYDWHSQFHHELLFGIVGTMNSFDELRRLTAAKDAVIEAADGYFKFTEEANATSDKGHKVFMTGWGNSLSRALARLKAVRDE